MTDALRTMGKVLKAERVRQRLSAEGIHDATRISAKYISAIEDDRYDEFPAPVYVKGFVRSYCEHLGMDFETLWNEFHPAPAPRADEPAQHSDSPVKPSVPYETQHFNTPAISHAKGFTGIALFILILGIIWLFRLPDHETINLQQPDNRGLDAETEIPRLKAVFTAGTWIRVDADDKTVREGYALQGSSFSYRAMRTGYRIKVREPEAVSFYLSDKAVDRARVSESFTLP